MRGSIVQKTIAHSSGTNQLLIPTPALTSYLTTGKMLWMRARGNLDIDPGTL